MSDQSPSESRVIELEFQLAHLQHDFDHLNAECLRQQSQIQEHQRRIESLERTLRELIGKESQIGEIED